MKGERLARNRCPYNEQAGKGNGTALQVNFLLPND